MIRRLLSLGLVVALMVVMAPAALAQEEGGEESVGLLPDSALYFIQEVMERVQLAFTQMPEDRAAFLAELLERRAAELQAMVAKGRGDLAGFLASRQAGLTEDAQEALDAAIAQGADVTEAAAAVEEATRKAAEVLAGVLEQVPDQARAAIELAMSMASTGRDTALGVLGKIAAGEIPGDRSVAEGILGKVGGLKLPIPGGGSPGSQGQGQQGP